MRGKGEEGGGGGKNNNNKTCLDGLRQHGTIRKQVLGITLAKAPHFLRSSFQSAAAFVFFGVVVLAKLQQKQEDTCVREFERYVVELHNRCGWCVWKLPRFDSSHQHWTQLQSRVFFFS
jgi:hypothetical protein